MSIYGIAKALFGLHDPEGMTTPQEREEIRNETRQLHAQMDELKREISDELKLILQEGKRDE